MKIMVFIFFAFRGGFFLFKTINSGSLCSSWAAFPYKKQKMVVYFKHFMTIFIKNDKFSIAELNLGRCHSKETKKRSRLPRKTTFLLIFVTFWGEKNCNKKIAIFPRKKIAIKKCDFYAIKKCVHFFSSFQKKI